MSSENFFYVGSVNYPYLGSLVLLPTADAMSAYESSNNQFFEIDGTRRQFLKTVSITCYLQKGSSLPVTSTDITALNPINLQIELVD